MNRLGTVLTFKEGTTREEAVEALRKIEDVLSLSDFWRERGEDPIEMSVHEYDDYNGTSGPVWYLP